MLTRTMLLNSSLKRESYIRYLVMFALVALLQYTMLTKLVH